MAADTKTVRGLEPVTNGNGNSFMVDHDAQVIALLGQLGGQGVRDEDVIFEGTKIILPETMNINEVIGFLIKREEQEEKTTTYSRVFQNRPMDGAHATQVALRKAFGMVGARSTYSMFGEIPPKLITLNVGPNETEQVPWGVLTLPILPGASITLGATNDPEWGPLFALTIEGPRKYRHQVEGIFKLIEAELRENSIYKGKAIDGKNQPDFLELDGVDPTQVIYTEEVTNQLEASVWSLLRYSEVTRQHGLPLKRAVLLEGPYGCGKTLAAYITAQLAQSHGWTFIMCRPGRDDLDLVMQTARLYQPAVVFYEDIDTIASPDDDPASDTTTRLLDRFDGVNAKGTELLMVLTTNHADRIHKGMVRPGRLDAVIHVAALDAGGVERMIQAVVPSQLLGTELNFEEIGEAMEGFLPAFVKEAIDRALRYSIARTKGNPTTLETQDFVEAAKGLRPQLELMKGAKEDGNRDGLTVVLDRTIRRAVDGTKVVDNDGDTMFNLVDPLAIA